jgi:hypothetical protein
MFFNDVVVRIKVKDIFWIVGKVMIRVSPVKPDVYSTFVLAILVNNISFIVKQVVRVFICANKLPLEDYLHVIRLYPPGEYDASLIDGNIGVF